MRLGKILRFVAILFCFVGLLYLYFAFLHPVQRVPTLPFFETEGPLVMAHRGGAGLRPENTLSAFRRAQELGVDVLEMDLRRTSDGAIVLMHDASVDRTTDGTGAIEAMSLREVQALDAGYHFRDENGDWPYRGRGITVPTLEETLDVFPQARFNIEITHLPPDSIRAVCQAIRGRGLEREVLVGSFDHEAMRSFRRDCPEVATATTMREGLIFYQLHRMGLGRIYRGPAAAFEVPEYLGDLQVVSDWFLAKARERNLRTIVWTVNDPADMERLLSMGVDGILTDFPDRLLEAAGRSQTRRHPAAE